MICQATYDSLDAIPESLRGEFEQKNGKWVLKADAIPGAAELLNPGLASNRDRAVDQARQRGERVTELEGQLATAQSELNAVRQPGSVVLSGDDAKSWQGYTQMGTVKELKKIHEAYPQLVAQVEGQAKLGSLQQVATDARINFDVLKDWSQSDLGKGLEFFTKEVDGEDGKKIKKLFVKKSEEKDGKVEVSELDFDQATVALPSYMKEALIKVDAGSTDQLQSQAPTNNNGGGIRMPNLGGGSSNNSGNQDSQPKRLVDKFNARRAAKPNPLKPAASSAGSN